MNIRSRPLFVWCGPLLALATLVILPEDYSSPEGGLIALDFSVRAALAVSLWMATWWVSEAVPLAVTALIPVAVFPALGVIPLKSAASSYAHPLIFLFLGGFLLSISLQKWQLHRRFAVSLLRRVGTRPAYLIGGFMLGTALLSMWLSNTATTIMMLPIALSVVASANAGDKFAPCLLLGIAYSASIGGMATLIGTPPNLFIASYFTDILGVEIGFLNWMLVGVPCVAVLLPAAWLYLTKARYKFADDARIDAAALSGHGLVWRELDRAAKLTLMVFLALVLAWVLRPVVKHLTLFGAMPFQFLSDAGLALVAAMTLFVIPVHAGSRERVLEWSDTKHVPWGTLILFGGGLSLAAALNTTGADQVLAHLLSGLPPMPAYILLAIIVAAVILLTELTSNIATTTTLVPVLAVAAPLLGLDTESVIAMIALAASCAFMLPVATPPNAIVFSSGLVAAREMAFAGITMNIIALLVISTLGYWLVPHVL